LYEKNEGDRSVALFIYNNMKIKEFIKNVLFYMTVPKCVCCRRKLNKKDRALCSECIVEFQKSKERVCSVCFKKLPECKCPNEYLERHTVHKLVKIFRYKPSVDPNIRVAENELIYNIKRVKRRDLIDFISDEMSEPIKKSLKYQDYVITNVPRKEARVLEYGLDHSEEIAKAIAKKLGIEYVKLLKSKQKKPQKKVHGEQRIKNAEFDCLKKHKSVLGKRVILFDDIVTTGASMGACAMLIRGLGAKEIAGACMAIAFKDKYTPFEKSESDYKWF